MCVTTATICKSECQEKGSTVEWCICSTRKCSPFLLFHCHPFSTKVKVCWKSVVCLGKKFFADLQKPGTAAACEHSERLDRLSGLSEVSQLTESVILAHILERNTFTESVTMVAVYLKLKLLPNGAPSICTFHNLSSAPIPHRGDFLWWNLCQMLAYNASFSDVTIPAALNSLMKIQGWLVTSWFRDVIFVTRRRLCVIGFLQGGIRGVPPAALLLLGQRTVKITRGQLDCVGCKCCVKANLWFTRPLNFTLRHKILVLRRIEEC